MAPSRDPFSCGTLRPHEIADRLQHRHPEPTVASKAPAQGAANDEYRRRVRPSYRPADERRSAAEWQRIAPSLPGLGVDTMLDRALICAYCTSVAQLADVRALWTEQGSPATVMRPAGERPHPLLDLVRSLTRDVALFGEQLGLSPRGRRALGVQVVPQAEPDTSPVASPRRPYFD